MPIGVYLHKKGYKRSKEIRQKISIAQKGLKRWENKIHPRGMLGKIPWNKGKRLSEEHRKKLSNAQKGKVGFWKDKKLSQEHIKKLSDSHMGQFAWNKGKKLSEEIRNNMSRAKLKKPTRYWLGKNRPAYMQGKKHSEETRKKISQNQIGKLSGSRCHFWKGGITSLCDSIRCSFEGRQWVKNIFKRDNYTCQECFKIGEKLHSHHIKPFNIILQEFLQQYSQFSPIEDKETLARLATTYEPFWDTNNGIALCKECHKKTGSYLNKKVKEEV